MKVIESKNGKCVVFELDKLKTVLSIPEGTRTLIIDQMDEWGESSTVEIPVGDLIRALYELNPRVD